MYKKIFKRALSLMMSILLIMGTLTCAFAANGKALSFKAPDGRVLTSLKEYSVTPSISQQNITTISDQGGDQVQAFAVTIDPNVNGQVGFLAGYTDYRTDGVWGMQTVRDQAKAAERATGKKVVAAINGDYYNMSTGEPLGMLIMGGKVVHENPYYPYFAVTKDGKFELREAGSDYSDVVEAIGSPFWLVKDGQVCVDEWNIGGPMPRCAVGIKENGEVVIYTADGRQAPKSCGEDARETAKMMVALGCVKALYLDGGGSATICSKAEGTDSLSVANSPSDGTERLVSSSLLIYSDEKGNGEFDHAALSPVGETYTPGSTVQVSAKGVDSAGGAAQLPEDLTYSVSDDTMGSVDPTTGLFTSSGKTGEVTVIASSAGKSVGSTVIEIQQPDSITFTNEEISLGFEAETDLGLYVSYKGKAINYKDGDFVWSFADVDPADKTLGTFTGNLFKSSDGDTVKGTVICKYKDSDVSGSISVIVGLKPTVVMDFESIKNEEGETVTSAKDYWTSNKAVFEAGGGLILGVWDTDCYANANASNFLGTTGSAVLLHGGYVDDVNNPYSGRGGDETLEIVDIASGEPVRFGNNSLKLSFDFTKDIKATEGACFGFSNATQEIPGNPTAIGVYVYAPEGTPNLWLRIRVKDGTGAVQTLNFTDNGSAEIGSSVSATSHKGIDWTGWKYLEAKLETTKDGVTTPLKGPFSLIGGETFRMMYLTTTGGNFTYQDGKLVRLNQSQRKGSIYIDNLQFVYGANTDDIDNPYFSNITANAAELTDGTEITTNVINFEATALDVENKYTSGVDFDTAVAYIDGEAVTNSITDPSKDAILLQGYYLANGEHNIKFLVRDGFGNETTKSVNFVVNGNEQIAPEFGFKAEEETVVLYGDANLTITSDKLEDVKDVTAKIKLTSEYTDYEVIYADGFEEAAAPVYNAKESTVTVSAKKTDGATVSGAGKVATLKVKIPGTINKGSNFQYSVVSAKANVVDKDAKDMTVSFFTTTKKLPITAKYILDIPVLTEGYDTKLTVYDTDGNVVKGASIYKADGTLLGTTGLNGSLYTSVFRDAQSVSVYAVAKDGFGSFIENTQTYPTGASEDGQPTFISLNASEDSETSKTVTWISKPGVSDDKAVVMVADKADYEANGDSAFVKYTGKCESLEFDGGSNYSDNKIVYANTVVVDGLTADTDYVYYVGDGKIWSEKYNFATNYNGQNTKFFVIGDAQASDTSIIKGVVDKLKEDNYAFGIQTGDFVEQAGMYSHWSEILTAFDVAELKGTDFLHVLGNHESYGDSDASIVKGLFNIPDSGCYSATYGNVYVAVLPYASTEKEVEEITDWLRADASKSDAIWKIVTLHQPPYGTNATTDDSAAYGKYLPEVCDAVDIDFVFSGHDHSYARTYPLTNGKTDEENGTVYFICGSTGEKSYAVTKNDAVHVIATNEYSGLYLTVDATNDTFTVTAYEGSGNIYDRYVKTKTVCENNIHSFVYKNDGHLVCEKCGYARETGSYTGFVTDYKTGIKLYLTNGSITKNKWFADGDDTYYFGADGFCASGTVTIDGKEYTFDKDGKFVRGSFVDEEITLTDGTKKTITRYYTAGGIFAIKWVEIDGSLYYFKKYTGNYPDDGEMFTGTRTVGTPNGNSRRTFTFDEQGRLILGAFEEDKDASGKLVGTRYYWGENYVTGTVNIGGIDFTFDKDGYVAYRDISNCSFKCETNFEYTGKEIKPSVTVKDGDVTLKSGSQYTVSYSDNKNEGTATITITGNTAKGYNGTKTIKFNIYKNSIAGAKVTTSKSTYVYEGSAIVPAVTVKLGSVTLKNGVDYTLTYSNNKAPGKATITVTGIGKYKGTVSKTFTITARPPKTVTATASGSLKSVTVKWSTVKEAKSYVVYRREASEKDYKKIVTVKAGTTKYVDSKVKPGKKYYYRIVTKMDKTAYDSVKSTYAKVAVVPATVKAVKFTSAKTALTLNITKVSGATGYVIYRYNAKTKKWVKVKTTTSATFKDTGLSKNTTYKYKVKAYKVVDGKTYYGSTSAEFKAKTKK